MIRKSTQYLTLIDPLELIGKALKLVDESYLFRWEEVPGKDSNRLMEYLKNKYFFYWVEKAKIEKNNDNTIRIFTNKYSLSFTLIENLNYVNLKIDDNRNYKLDIGFENCVLNVYDQRIYDEAFELFSQAEELADRKKRIDGLAAVYGTIGSVYAKRDNFDDAERFFKEALFRLEILVTNNPFYKIWMARVQRNFGNLLKKKGTLKDAEDKYQTALKIFEVLYEKEPSNIIYQIEIEKTLNEFAELYKNMGKFHDAEIMSQHALELRVTPNNSKCNLKMNTVDIAGILNYPKCLGMNKFHEEVDFTIEKFLNDNHKFFPILGVLGGLSIYMNSLFLQTNPNSLLGVGIISSLFLFILVALKICSTVFEEYEYTDIGLLWGFFSLSIGNLKRISFIIPILIITFSIISYIYNNVNFKSFFEIVLTIFQIIITTIFYKNIERWCLKFINKPEKSRIIFIVIYGLIFILLSLLIIFILDKLVFLRSVLLKSLLSLFIVFLYFVLRLDLYILDFGYYKSNYFNTLINLNRFKKPQSTEDTSQNQ